MNNRTWDAIVVGARCAGAPTAMLLARKGYRVLVVDRATFPSDTISTHLIHPDRAVVLHQLLECRRHCHAVDDRDGVEVTRRQQLRLDIGVAAACEARFRGSDDRDVGELGEGRCRQADGSSSAEHEDSVGGEEVHLDSLVSERLGEETASESRRPGVNPQ